MEIQRFGPDNLPSWLVSAFEASWSRETSSDPARWTPENASLGQCAVTALVLQDVTGGELLRLALPEGGSHYWNRLPSGVEVDLTRGQFCGRVDLVGGEIRSRAYVLSFPATRVRYRLLRQRMQRVIGGRQVRTELHG